MQARQKFRFRKMPRRSCFNLSTSSNRHNKTTSGRTYLAGGYRNNIIRWRNLDPGDAKANTDAIRIGGQSAEETIQMRLSLEGNRFENFTGRDAPVEISVHGAIVNGEPLQEKKMTFPRR